MANLFLESIGGLFLGTLLFLIIFNMIIQVHIFKKHVNWLIGISIGAYGFLLAGNPVMRAIYLAFFVIVAGVGKFLGSSYLIISIHRKLYPYTKSGTIILLLLIVLFIIGVDFMSDLVISIFSKSLSNTEGLEIIKLFSFVLLTYGVAEAVYQPAKEIFPGIVHQEIQSVFLLVFLLVAIFWVPVTFPQIEMVLKISGLVGFGYGLSLILQR